MKTKEIALAALLVAAGLYDLKAANIFVSKLNDTQIEQLSKGLSNSNVNPAQKVAAVTCDPPGRIKG